MIPNSLTLGPIALDRASQVLRGPSGRVPLPGRSYRVLARLLARPGALVSQSDVIAAMYAHPDDEAAEAAVMARQQIRCLRAELQRVGAGDLVVIRNAHASGYAIEEVREAEAA